MCLSIVKKDIEDDSKLSEGVGYKIFRRYNPKYLFGEYYTPISYKDTGYPIGKWIKSDDAVYTDDWSYSYPPGFHIFTSLKSAVKWLGPEWGRGRYIIRQVRYRNAHTIGCQVLEEKLVQLFVRCVVATEIKIGKEIKRPNHRRGKQ